VAEEAVEDAVSADDIAIGRFSSLGTEATQRIAERKSRGLQRLQLGGDLSERGVLGVDRGLLALNLGNVCLVTGQRRGLQKP